MRFLILFILAAVTLAVASGGGILVGYIPGNILKTPLGDLKFGEGIFIFGGIGEGEDEGWCSGGGGGGGERSIVLNGVEYKLSTGFGMGYFSKVFSVDPFELKVGLGFGDISLGISRKVEGGVDFGSFQNGSAEGYISMSVDYLSIFPIVEFNLKIIPYMEIFVGAIGFLGYSFDGWKLETGSSVEGLDEDYRLSYGYVISSGLLWGF